MSDAQPREPSVKTLIAEAVAELPGEIREEVAGWMRLAEAASAAEVQQELVGEAQAALAGFREAAAKVQRMIGK